MRLRLRLEVDTTTSLAERRRMKFLVQFANHLIDFRLPTFDSDLAFHGLDPAAVYSTDSVDSPFLEVELESEEVARKVALRSVLIKSIFEVWAAGDTHPVLHEDLRARLAADAGAGAEYQREDRSWRLRVDAFGRKFTDAEKEQRRQPVLAILKFKGPVSLSDPTHRFVLMEDVGGLEAAGKCTTPRRVYLLREMADSMRSKGLLDQTKLKSRAYLGPTSTDHELSLLMASLGKVGPQSVVLDPFVGTGSLLIAAASFGGTCVGTDIDLTMLDGTANFSSAHGRDASANVFSNFAQLGLPPPEIVCLDIARSPMRPPDLAAGGGGGGGNEGGGGEDGGGGGGGGGQGGGISAGGGRRVMSRRPMFDAILSDVP